MKAAIYHNPRCSKSRAALALLTEAGADVRIVEYLKTPPTREELAALLARANLTPREALRTTEPEAKPLKAATDAQILDAMVAHPILLERPIVETAKGTLIARPPERVHELLWQLRNERLRPPRTSSQRRLGSPGDSTASQPPETPASAGVTFAQAPTTGIVIPAQAGSHTRNGCNSTAKVGDYGFPPSRE